MKTLAMMTVCAAILFAGAAVYAAEGQDAAQPATEAAADVKGGERQSAVADISANMEKATSLTQEITGLLAIKGSLEKDREKLETMVKGLQYSLGGMKTDIESLDAEKKLKLNEIAKLNAERGKLEEQLTYAQKRIAEMHDEELQRVQINEGTYIEYSCDGAERKRVDVSKPIPIYSALCVLDVRWRDGLSSYREAKLQFVDSDASELYAKPLTGLGYSQLSGSDWYNKEKLLPGHTYIVKGVEFTVARYVSFGCAWPVVGSKLDGVPLIVLSYGELYNPFKSWPVSD